MIIYDCTTLNLACAPTIMTDGLDEKRGAVHDWLRARFAVKPQGLWQHLEPLAQT